MLQSAHILTVKKRLMCINSCHSFYIALLKAATARDFSVAEHKQPGRFLEIKLNKLPAIYVLVGKEQNTVIKSCWAHLK